MNVNVAAKKFLPRELKNSLKEANILQNLSILYVTYHGIYQDEEQTTWIITEYMDKGGLDQLLKIEKKLFTKIDLVSISQQISSGMIYLSQQGIVHVIFLFSLIDEVIERSSIKKYFSHY